MNEKDAAMSGRARLFYLVLLGSLLVLWSNACQSDPSSGEKQAPPATSASARSLVVWHALPQDERLALEDLRRDFEAAHPFVDVQLVPHSADTLLPTFRDQVLAGAGPDLLIIQHTDLPALAETGMIQSLDEALLDALMAYQAEMAFSAASLDGTPYGVVLATEFPTLYYRHSQFTPSFASLEDFTAQAQAASLVIPPTFVATAGFLLAADPAPFDEDGPSKPALLSYFTTLASLSASPLVQFTTDPAAFLNGSAALLVASSSDYPQLVQALGDDLGVVAWPGQGWRTPIQAGPVIVISLNITRESANAADQFLAHLLAPDSQARWHARTGQAPANPYALPDRDLLSAWGKTLQAGVPLLSAPQGTAQKLATLDIAIKDVVTGRLTPGSATDYVLGAFSTP